MRGKNYEKMEQQARELFLQADQDEILRTWQLEADERWIYVDFISQQLKIDRATAEIAVPEPGSGSEALASQDAGREALGGSTYNRSMVLFDILTRTGTRPRPSGSWASISMLGGHIGANHDRTLRNEPQAARFAGQTQHLRLACEALGGRPESKADVGYSIPVFGDLRVLFQFWDADDEFPASIKYLFDANALQFMHYETLWYLMGAVYSRIESCFEAAAAD